MPDLFVLTALLTIVVPAAAQPVFVIEIVDDAGNVGYHASLALDSQGRPHISHSEVGVQPPGELLYATKSNGAWSRETVYQYGGTRFGHNLVVMPGDVPAVAAGGTFRIRSAPSVWDEETLGSGYNPWYSMVAVDRFGRIHGTSQWSWGTGIYSGFVDYVYRSQGGAWGDEPLSGAPFIPTDPQASMAFDAENDPHVALRTSVGEVLTYYENDNGQWSSEVIASSGYGSIQIDDLSNEPRIAYYDGDGLDLVMAYRVGDSWTAVPIDVAGNVGAYPSHAIHEGVSHVAYYDRDLGDLKYAVVSPGAPATIMTVDSDGDVGAYASLAIDALGRIHIAYFDGTNGALKYAMSQQAIAAEESTAGRVKYMFRK